jgi:hypothetical protein
MLLWARNWRITRTLWEGALSSWSSQMPARHNSVHFRRMSSLSRAKNTAVELGVHGLAFGSKFMVHSPSNVKKTRRGNSPETFWYPYVCTEYIITFPLQQRTGERVTMLGWTCTVYLVTCWSTNIGFPHSPYLAILMKVAQKSAQLATSLQLREI